MSSNFRTAISFLTILPIKPPVDLSSDTLARSTTFFPIAGWVIGAFLAVVCWLGTMIGLPSEIIAVLMVGFGAWLTRGLHLDGVADLFDGLGGSHEPEKRLAIMKDSSIGTFGIVGLAILLLLKVFGLAALQSITQYKYLLIASVPACARWAVVCLAYKSSYPRKTGTGHAFVGNVKRKDLFIGGLTLLPLILFAGFSGLVILLSCQMPAFWLRRKARRAFGGVTGDVLGASCEMGEAVGWLAAILYVGAI